MNNGKTLVVTAYGHNKAIDKIVVSSFESPGTGYYNNPGSDAVTYCDTINSFELKGESWVFAKIISENRQYSLGMFLPMRFSDIILKLDNMAIQKILRELDSQEICMSLKGEDETVQEKIFSNMTKRASQMLKEDMECIGPVRINGVKESQEKILGVIRRLIEYGEILIPDYEGETAK
ncbi:hypothetical protein AGMMS49579_07300 [Spirochaetia bacterium]|nr:hypothetical protein AGMMS49579_07300 [Spirochaetia bacterium]